MTPEQSKAARALLGISAVEAAKIVGVGVATMKRFESGQPVADLTIKTIKSGLESEGVIFIEFKGNGIGVKLKSK